MASDSVASGLDERSMIPPQWEEAANSISSSAHPPISLICGPKNSGKSTFSRHLLNTLLQRYGTVAYLDTDVGQPEFSPPGCLSLHLIHDTISDMMNPHIKTPERLTELDLDTGTTGAQTRFHSARTTSVVAKMITTPITLAR